MTSEGLGEMFKGDSADTLAGKFPLGSMVLVEIFRVDGSTTTQSFMVGVDNAGLSAGILRNIKTPL